MNDFYLDPTMYDGRPADCTGRDAVEVRCYDLLDSLGVAYKRLDHDATPSMEACGEVEALFGVEICKNLFLCNRQKTQFTLLLMPGGKPFRTKELCAQLGCSRLSFADEGHMQEYLGVTPGSVTILGLMNDPERRVRLVIDRDAFSHEYFACHPCRNTSSVRMKTKDVLAKVLPALGHEVTYVSL